VSKVKEENQVTPEHDAGEEDQGPELEKEPSLEEQLAESQTLAADYLDGWQRARAELANFKRRSEAQRAAMILMANAGLLEKLLPVLDDLQLALNNTPSSEPDSGTAAWQEWQGGVTLITHKFATVLEEVGIVPIETDGQLFDPTVHEAISYEDHPDLESGQVIAELRKGYKLGNHVLRASMVRVAR